MCKCNLMENVKITMENYELDVISRAVLTTTLWCTREAAGLDSRPLFHFFSGHQPCLRTRIRRLGQIHCAHVAAVSTHARSSVAWSRESTCSYGVTCTQVHHAGTSRRRQLGRRHVPLNPISLLIVGASTGAVFLAYHDHPLIPRHAFGDVCKNILESL